MYFLRLIAWIAVLNPAWCEDGGGSRVDVGENVHVSAARSDFEHNHVVLAADPADPSRLLVGSNIVYGGKDEGYPVIVYRSVDRGRTWGTSLELKDGSSDPSLAFGPGGVAYFATMGDGKGAGEKGLGARVLRSPDGGATWGLPVNVDPRTNMDRGFLAVDCSGGANNGRVYYNTQIKFSPLQGTAVQGTIHPPSAVALYASGDGARSFPLPSFLAVRPAFQPYYVNAMSDSVILSDGMVVTLCHADDTRDPQAEGEVATSVIRVLRSNDGGSSYLDEDRGRVGSWYRKNRPGTWWLGESIPRISVGPPSSAAKDHLYAVWSDARTAGNRVMFSASWDRGLSWSRPSPLREPDATGPPKSDGFIPVIAVNRDGVVGVLWYDSRDHTGEGHGWHVRFQISPDGGATWLPSVRVSSEPSTFRSGKIPYVAETIGLAAGADGSFHAAWADHRAAIGQVWGASIRVETGR